MSRALVGGGENNEAARPWSTVGGGRNNHAEGDAATVGGGGYNWAFEDASTVGGGQAALPLPPATVATAQPTVDKTIDTIDPNGIALAAIQGLNELVREKDAEIEDLRTANEALLARMECLEAAVVRSTMAK